MSRDVNLTKGTTKTAVDLMQRAAQASAEAQAAHTALGPAAATPKLTQEALALASQSADAVGSGEAPDAAAARDSASPTAAPNATPSPAAAALPSAEVGAAPSESEILPDNKKENEMNNSH